MRLEADEIVGGARIEEGGERRGELLARERRADPQRAVLPEVVAARDTDGMRRSRARGQGEQGDDEGSEPPRGPRARSVSRPPEGREADSGGAAFTYAASAAVPLRAPRALRAESLRRRERSKRSRARCTRSRR